MYWNIQVIFCIKHSFKQSGVLEVAQINHQCCSANSECCDFSLVWKTVAFQENSTSCKSSTVCPLKHKEVKVQVHLLGKAVAQTLHQKVRNLCDRCNCRESRKCSLRFLSEALSVLSPARKHLLMS